MQPAAASHLGSNQRHLLLAAALVDELAAAQVAVELWQLSEAEPQGPAAVASRMEGPANFHQGAQEVQLAYPESGQKLQHA